MRSDRNPCRGWRNGDMVSQHVGRIERIGKAVSLTRRSDGQRFWMVDILGRREWPDGWALGHGPYLHSCLGCEQPYRTSDPEPDMCPACMRDEQQNMHPANATRSIGATLRGASSQVHRCKPSPQAEIDAQKRRDESDSIF